MIYQNTIIQFVAFFIPNRKLRHTFRNRFKTKSKYDILHDENIMLKKEINQLKAQCKIMRTEYKYLNYKYALPEQRPEMLKDIFSERMSGVRLNLDNPRTFSEKIQWLKLNDMDDIKTILSDKYLVKEWVSKKIGEQYVIPLIGVYDTPEEIKWDDLPNEFVIKCNHGCAMNIIIKNKKDINQNTIKARLNQWLSINFAFRAGFEMQYAAIRPKVIIEKKIENEGYEDLIDYKFLCFDGVVKYIQLIVDRSTNMSMVFYDLNWVKQSFTYNYPLYDKEISKPDNLDLMVNLAQKLAEGFKFVRVDFYRLNDGTIYFGEMTFTPYSGYFKWNKGDTDRMLGDLLKI